MAHDGPLHPRVWPRPGGLLYQHRDWRGGSSRQAGSVQQFRALLFGQQFVVPPVRFQPERQGPGLPVARFEALVRIPLGKVLGKFYIWPSQKSLFLRPWFESLASVLQCRQNPLRDSLWRSWLLPIRSAGCQHYDGQIHRWGSRLADFCPTAACTPAWSDQARSPSCKKTPQHGISQDPAVVSNYLCLNWHYLLGNNFLRLSHCLHTWMASGGWSELMSPEDTGVLQFLFARCQNSRRKSLSCHRHKWAQISKI